ncbi:Uncharacterised protein [Zhongshania aliphaticivorans]|uniref:Uncharacterized protein n=1 Tax=Zhongshania aliphaticivorans TaxID=1470434 RepID=A0A5S9NEY2_9GAMM|nr:hypothetical protein [Zhongshania aliphaticivorans]CAA0088580.1 Uncharacterised protein [Zhongshania aliphaticivorans]CAA0094666.1 Uncharacterised protein [Zhongshania aliphaticivorans]
MEIFVRQFDEGTGIGIAYDYEQATLHRKPPEISPSLISSQETIAEFNNRLKQAVMDASSVAPETLPIETYIEVLQEITGG